jgi:hypothetical protein
VVVGCLAVLSVTLEPRVQGGRLEVIQRGESAPAHSFPLGAGKNKFVLSPVDMKRYAMRAETAAHQSAPLSEPLASSEPLTVSPTLAQRRNELVLENAALESDAALLEREVAELEARRGFLANRKALLKRNFEWLSARVEGGKLAELEELKDVLGVDEEVLACYTDQKEGLSDAETLLANVKTAIEKLEAQIRLFVQARQRKNLAIEQSLKAGARKNEE